MTLRALYGCIVSCCAIALRSQTVSADTVRLYMEQVSACHGSHTLTASEGTFSFNGKKIGEPEYRQRSLLLGAICDSIDKAAGRYCRFYRNQNMLVPEGRWHIEFFSGPYKSYYPTGRLKTSGEYNAEGEKTAVWLFYTKKGRVRKKIRY